MLCDICNKNQATVHLTEIVDDQMTELHLCEECARQKSEQMEQQFGLSDLLAGMAEFTNKPVQDKEVMTAKCKKCGLTFADFKKIGRLGCSECYSAFRQYLAPLLKRIHGSSSHVGKSPIMMAQKVTAPKKDKETGVIDDLAGLRQKLQKAIEAEEFEEAAKLRDQIRNLEKKE
ncbi:MAG: UvrB/UvrC motif-containing protein [Candidatus Omnitrophota bacterium]